MIANSNFFKINYDRAVYLSILFMTFFTAPLCSYSPIRFSDIGCLIMLYIGFKHKKTIKTYSYNYSLLFLCVWAIMDMAIIPLLFDDFSYANHVTQFLRFSAAVILFLYIPNIIDCITIDKVLYILRKVLMTHIYIQLIYVILYYFNIRFFFNIINSFEQRMDLIAYNYKFFNHFVILNNIDGTPRFSGFFEEPAWFGWSLNLILAILLQAEFYYNKYLTRSDFIKIAIGYVFTASLSCLFSFFVILGFYIFQKHKRHFCKLIMIGASMIVIIFIFIILSPSLLARLVLISDGGDGSSSSRIIGSYNALVSVLNEFPITGYGLGDLNSTLFFSYLSKKGVEYGIAIGDIYLIEIHNMIVQIICSLGIIGCMFFLYPFSQIIKRKNIIVGISFILLFFTVNVFNTFYLLTITGIALYLFSNKKIYKI